MAPGISDAELALLLEGVMTSLPDGSGRVALTPLEALAAAEQAPSASDAAESASARKHGAPQKRCTVM